MGLGFILFLGGLVIIAGMYFWTRQRQSFGYIPSDEQEYLSKVPHATHADAVLVSREHGKLVFANENAQRWLGLNSSAPNLEVVAAQAQPVDSFLELFALDRQVSFQLGPRWVEASSHTIPNGADTRTVVVMREISANTSHPGSLDLSLAMRVINEIGETTNPSMGMQQVYQALLTIILKAVPASAGEICIWDSGLKQLSPLGWVGDAPYLIKLQEQGGVYKLGEGITGWIAQQRKAVLVSSTLEPTAVQPKLPGFYSSFVGVPLLLGDRFIGTLELAHRQPDVFTQSHLALLQAVGKQVATSIYNTELYTAQAQRIQDMSSVGDLLRSDRAGDTRKLYLALNERVARILSVSAVGVLIYDENRRALVPEIPFHGLPDQLAQSCVIPLPADSPQRDIYERQDYWVSNDVADDALIDALGLSSIFSVAGIKNLALLPLQIGTQRIGMLLVGNKKAASGFSSQDIREMKLLAAQSAVVVENQRLHQLEQRRDSELTGLQEITHAIGSLNREEEFYSTINQRIAAQMGVSMCGILIYEERRQALVARLPFHGVADDAMRGYSIDIEPGSPLASIWEDMDFWYTNRVSSDAVVYAAGLAEFAAQLGVHKTLMAVLAVGGRRLGVVQVSNKLNGEDFTDKDARLLLIFGAQAAAMIENARLYRDMQRSAEEATSLRQVAELAGSILTPDEPMTPVLHEISHLTRSPIVFLNVLDQQTGSLTTFPRYVYGAELAEPVIYDIFSKHFEHSVALSHQEFFSNDLLNDPRMLESYRTTATQFGLRSVVMVPLLVGDRSLGELGIANREEPYSQADVEMLSAIATQIGATVERLRLYEAAGENLNRRLLELDAISQISNRLAETLDIDQVLDTIREEAARATRADGSTIALLKPAAEWQIANEPELRKRLGGADVLTGLADIEREAVSRGAHPLLVTDYLTASFRPMPSQARSAVAIAFLYEDHIVGVIHLYHSRPNNFDERAAAFLLTLAAKASLGYGNYIRYQEQVDRSLRLRQRVEQLNQIFELGRLLQGNNDPVSVLEEILSSIQEAAGFDVGVVTLLDDSTSEPMLRRMAQLGMPLDAFQKSQTYTLTVSQARAFLQPDYRISESYFYPAEQRDKWPSVPLEALRIEFDGKRAPAVGNGPHQWREGDLLLLPLESSDGNLEGIISLDLPRDGQRPDRGTIEVLEIFAHEAEATIENIRLYLSSVENAEQEASLSEMMKNASASLDTIQVVEAVAKDALGLIPFDRLTAALLDAESQGFDVITVDIQTDGSLITQTEHQTILLGTALGQVMVDGQEKLFRAGMNGADDFDDVKRWLASGELTSLILPLNVGTTRVGVLHLGSSRSETLGQDEYRPLLRRVANIASISVQNARLFDQAMRLQNFNESVVESIQQGIVVLDKTGRILSVNDFMAQRYGWSLTESIQRNLFDYRPELLDILQDDLQLVLEVGKPRERIWQIARPEDDHPQKMLVSNYYLYPLRGAEGIRGAVLLVEDVTERALLERDLESRATQLGVLTEVSSRITASLNRDEVINLALGEIGRVIQFDTMTLWTRQGSRVALEGAVGFEIEGAAVVKIASHERIRLVVERLAPYSINNLLGLDPLPGEDQAKSWLGVPLVNQGHVVGMIALAKNEADFYDEQDEQAAFAFANQVAVALENANLYSEARHQTDRLAVLNRVSVSLAQSLDSENILEIALNEIAEAMRVPQARALLFQGSMQFGTVVMQVPRGDAPPDEIVNVQQSAVFQEVRRTAAPFIITDTNQLDANSAIRKEMDELKAQAYGVIPMTVSGQVIGAFDLLVTDAPRQFTAEQIDLSLIIANQAAIAVQNTNLLEQTLVRTRDLETLLEAAQATSLTMNLDEAYRGVTQLFLQALEMDQCALLIWDNIENTLTAPISLKIENDYMSQPVGPYDLRRCPAKRRSLETLETIVITADQPDADRTEVEELRASGYAMRVLIPLMVRDQAIGLVQVQRVSHNREFSHREIRLAQALGSQAAIAIQNARLSTETADLVEESFLVNSLSQAIGATLNIDEAIAIVRDQVPGVAQAEQMYLALYDADTQTISFPMAVTRAGQTFSIPDRPLGNDEVSYVIRHRRSLALGGGNWSSDEMRRNMKISDGEGSARSYLGVPIAAGDQVLGVLAVRDMHNTRAFGINTERLLTTVGTQLGAAIQNARLFNRISHFAEELNQRVQERTQELEQERDRLDTLYQITSELARTLDMDRVLDRALEMVADAVNADEGVIMLIDPLSGELTTRASRLAAGSVYPGEHPAGSLASWLVDHQKLLIAKDLHDEPYWDISAPGAAQWHSALAVLLETNDDPQGVMVLLSREETAFSETQLKLVIAAANQVAAAINNADLYHLIRDQAERLGTLVRLEQEEAEKNSAIVEAIADGVLLADSEGAIKLFNSAAERILELPRDQVIGQAMFRLTGLFGGTAANWAKAIATWMRSPSSYEPGDYQAETINMAGKMVRIILSPVYTGERFIGTVAVFRDITKEIEADRIKSEFISNVSHELRTPMTSIKGFADLLLMGVAGPMPEAQRGFITKIKANSERLSQLVDDLLNISRLDSGAELQFEMLDVGQVVQKSVDAVREQHEPDTKDLQVYVDIAPDLPQIEADRKRIEQIVTNIVDNAFNYTYDGGRIDVRVAPGGDQQSVLISVADTGIGIPEEFQPRVWDRFARYDNHALVMDVPGTGLGLSIVRELVLMHNGNIWFESETGKGTTFFIRLPIYQPTVS